MSKKQALPDEIVGKTIEAYIETSVYVLNLVLNMCLLFWALVLIFSNW